MARIRIGNVVGPPGAKGDKGDKGEKGDPGSGGGESDRVLWSSQVWEESNGGSDYERHIAIERVTSLGQLVDVPITIRAKRQGYPTNPVRLTIGDAGAAYLWFPNPSREELGNPVVAWATPGSLYQVVFDGSNFVLQDVFVAPPHTAATGTDYTAYRMRNVALLPSTPAFLANGDIAMVYD